MGGVVGGGGVVAGGGEGREKRGSFGPCRNLQSLPFRQLPYVDQNLQSRLDQSSGDSITVLGDATTAEKVGAGFDL